MIRSAQWLLTTLSTDHTPAPPPGASYTSSRDTETSLCQLAGVGCDGYKLSVAGLFNCSAPHSPLVLAGPDSRFVFSHKLRLRLLLGCRLPAGQHSYLPVILDSSLQPPARPPSEMKGEQLSSSQNTSNCFNRSVIRVKLRDRPGGWWFSNRT